jgi:hypothetical protein
MQEKETDRAILTELKKLEDCARAPVLKMLATNYTTGFFQLNRATAKYISVCKVDLPMENLLYSETADGYVSTFRISKTTYFRSLWQTACRFWVWTSFHL